MVGSVRRGAVAASIGYSLVAAGAMGHFLFGIPIQVSDSFGNLLAVRASWEQVLAQGFSANAYLRPLLWADLKLVFEASGGDYTLWFRGVHAAQIFAAAVLTLGLIRPRQWRDAATVPIGIAALFGIHTFKGTIVEAFPVNTFLTIVLCCLAAANLALRQQSRWWTDGAGLLLFLIAVLTVESGLLVWVVYIGAAMAGARGMSRRGLALLTALLAGYFVLRFGVLETGSPSLMERSSGFGFRVLDPPELEARFGQNPLAFYAYNVVTSFVSVLVGEPRAGVFRFVRAVATGTVTPAYVIAIVATSLGSMLMAAYVWQRRDAWRQRQLDRDDRVVALFLMLLAANAVISYPYTKDVIMSVAGAFYAAALAVAVRHTVLTPAAWRGGRRIIATATVTMTLASTWALLQINAHVNLRVASFKERNDWAYEPSRLAERGLEVAPEDRGVFDQLRQDAVRPPLPPTLWLQDIRIFDVD